MQNFAENGIKNELVFRYTLPINGIGKGRSIRLKIIEFSNQFSKNHSLKILVYRLNVIIRHTIEEFITVGIEPENKLVSERFSIRQNAQPTFSTT